jgi:hypothetical protein
MNTIRGREIKSVSIVDDDESAQKALTYSVEEAAFDPVIEKGPLRDLINFVNDIMKHSQAAICDHHLRKRNYASFDGAAAVAQLYSNRVPAVLCTRWDHATDEIRAHRRHIPVVLKPDELDPDTLTRGLEYCIDELEQRFRSNPLGDPPALPGRQPKFDFSGSLKAVPPS